MRKYFILICSAYIVISCSNVNGNTQNISTCENISKEEVLNEYLYTNQDLDTTAIVQQITQLYHPSVILDLEFFKETSRIVLVNLDDGGEYCLCSLKPSKNQIGEILPHPLKHEFTDYVSDCDVECFWITNYLLPSDTIIVINDDIYHYRYNNGGDTRELLYHSHYTFHYVLNDFRFFLRAVDLEVLKDTIVEHSTAYIQQVEAYMSMR